MDIAAEKSPMGAPDKKIARAKLRHKRIKPATDVDFEGKYPVPPALWFSHACSLTIWNAFALIAMPSGDPGE